MGCELYGTFSHIVRLIALIRCTNLGLCMITYENILYLPTCTSLVMIRQRYTRPASLAAGKWRQAHISTNE